MHATEPQELSLSRYSDENWNELVGLRTARSLIEITASYRATLTSTGQNSSLI